MKILITLGTTPFDSLVRFVDESKLFSSYIITMQTKGVYQPSNFSSFDFVNNIHEYYNDSDIVITHAGAGSIYKLLELGKKIVVIPNFERVDQHQADIAKYVEDNNLGLVCWSFKDLSKNITRYLNGFQPDVYAPKTFFKYNEISDYLI